MAMRRITHGGGMCATVPMAGVTGFNLYSLLVAIVGATAILVLYHAVFRALAG